MEHIEQVCEFCDGKLFKIRAIFRKVLNKLGFRISMESIKKIVDCQPGIIEVFLLRLKLKLEEHSTRRVCSDNVDWNDFIKIFAYRKQIKEKIKKVYIELVTWF